MVHVDEVLCHGENGWATWETSHGGCIMRKVLSKERLKFFWTLPPPLVTLKCLAAVLSTD